MTAPAPSGGFKLTAQQRKMAYGGGAAAAVAALVVVRSRGRSASVAAGGGTTAVGRSGNTVAAPSVGYATGPVAGLSGAPDTSATDIQNFLQNLANNITTAGVPAPPDPVVSAAQKPPAQDFTVPYVTGDIGQDTGIAQSPYVAGAYAAYKANPTQDTEHAYQGAYNQYVASIAR